MDDKSSYVTTYIKQPFNPKRRNAQGQWVDAPPSVVTSRAYFSRATINEAHFPQAVEVEDEGFGMCESLELVYMPLLRKTGRRAFQGCWKIDRLDTPHLEIVGDEAFKDCSNLRELGCGSLKQIGQGGFSGCKSLIDLTMPNCTHIGDRAFKSCDELSNVDAKQTTYIGAQAFLDCNSLVKLTFPRAIQVGSSAFKGCSSAVYIDLPGILSIPDQFLFGGCTSAKYVDISGVKQEQVKQGMFNGTSKLEWVDMSSAIEVGSADDLYRRTLGMPAECNIICQDGEISWGATQKPGMWRVDGIKYRVDSSGSFTIIGIDATSLPEQLVDGAASDIENEYMFQDHIELQEVFMPNLKKMSRGTFQGCSGLECARFPNLEKLGNEAFVGCSSLKYVRLGNANLDAIRKRTSELGFPSGCCVSCEKGGFFIVP